MSSEISFEGHGGIVHHPLLIYNPPAVDILRAQSSILPELSEEEHSVYSLPPLGNLELLLQAIVD